MGSCSDEGASRSGRQWFRRTLEGTFTRLTPDAHDDPALNRRTVAADHTLTLANVTEADVGFYICHDNEEPPAQYRMEYLLDGALSPPRVIGEALRASRDL
ncbi:hypothetical protein HPB48_005360 [Haemaphysalis longicornis]|uniref:Ig-like domain-containing protein n=1 Tax=Haemaphysalis longicornis TaxID=44386 RepID=A0A9J6GFW6_HAELO|nr:hypothetical protein HPB48_005360 [Haemaphysalis longicornis]